MDKNYYDWLEVNQNASQEVIEKAYKALVKKYHPDLQDGDNKINYEEYLKNINEAYETLSNPEKRTIYDKTLKENTISEEEFNNLYNENTVLKDELSKLKDTLNKNNTNIYNQEPTHQSSQNEQHYKAQQRITQEDYNQQLNNAINKAYHDAYIQDLKNRGYRIRYKKTFKDYVRIIVTCLAIIVFFIILWHTPFIHNSITNLYENNKFIKIFVDSLRSIFFNKENINY